MLGGGGALSVTYIAALKSTPPPLISKCLAADSQSRPALSESVTNVSRIPETASAIKSARPLNGKVWPAVCHPRNIMSIPGYYRRLPVLPGDRAIP